MFEKGSQEDVAAACALLDDYSGALTSELHQRDSMTALLEGLISAQVTLKPCSKSSAHTLQWCLKCEGVLKL